MGNEGKMQAKKCVGFWTLIINGHEFYPATLEVGWSHNDGASTFWTPTRDVEKYFQGDPVLIEILKGSKVIRKKTACEIVCASRFLDYFFYNIGKGFEYGIEWRHK